MKQLVFAMLALALLTGASVTSSVNIVVTHTITPPPPGGVIASLTIQNVDPVNPFVPGATGYPYRFGQGWQRGDLALGTLPGSTPQHPICEDHATQAVLQCQLDQIDTRANDATWLNTAITVSLPSSSPQYTAVAGGNGLAACTTPPCPVFVIDLLTASGSAP